MVNFINNYRLSVTEATGRSNYGEAIVRVILFPIFYLSAYLTDLLYKNTQIEAADKGGYIIDESGRLHLGNIVPRYRYTDVDEDVLGEALERSIHRANQTGQSVRLGDIIEEIKAERR